MNKIRKIQRITASSLINRYVKDTMINKKKKIRKELEQRFGDILYSKIY